MGVSAGSVSDGDDFVAFLNMTAQWGMFIVALYAAWWARVTFGREASLKEYEEVIKNLTLLGEHLDNVVYLLSSGVDVGQQILDQGYESAYVLRELSWKPKLTEELRARSDKLHVSFLVKHIALSTELRKESGLSDKERTRFIGGYKEVRASLGSFLEDLSDVYKGLHGDT